jgi:hypothetical protein
MFEIIAILTVVLDSFTAGFTGPQQTDADSVSLAHLPASLMSKLTQIFVNLDNRIGKAC